MKILAERLRLLRKEKGLRQEDMQEYLGISYNSYCRYEKGERDPNAPTIVIMADFFGVSADYLLGRKDERT